MYKTYTFADFLKQEKIDRYGIYPQREIILKEMADKLCTDYCRSLHHGCRICVFYYPL